MLLHSYRNIVTIASLAYNMYNINTFLGGITTMGPALLVPIDGIFIGDLIGFIISLPIALFLAFWMSAVKSRWVVVLGALVGAFIGFIFILGWVGTLIYDTPLPGANPPAVFFGSALLCSTLGIAGGIILDLIVARLTRHDYRRRSLVHE